MLRQRIITALIALSVLGVILYVLPADIARFLMALLILIGSWEWSGFCFRTKDSRRLIYVVFVGTFISILYIVLPDPLLLATLFKAALGWWLLAMVWMFFFPTPVPKLVAW
ncbi:uncharacterized protein METZ01_LOCUS249557, partial [marine metagenome]